MATTPRHSSSSSAGSLRYRYGMCLNDNCEKCKQKEILQIPVRKDFVCPECQKPLRECPPLKKKGMPGWILGIIIAAVLALAALLVWLFIPKDKTMPVGETEQVTVVEEPTQAVPVEEVADTIEAETPPEVVPEPVNPELPKAKEASAPQNGHGTVTLPYGKYTGDLKNGKPHGYGKITYTATHRITASKDFVADPGDTYEGEFRNGVPSGGRGYWDHHGDVKTITL